jgi:lauroyl/myristoyl acyltransferase
MPAAWRISVAAETCAAGVQNSFFGYLCFVLPQDKLAHLVDRLIHAECFAALERQLRQANGGIVATIHSDAYFIISVYLALRGHRVSLLANMKTAGVPLKDDPDFYKSYPRGFEDLIDSSTEDARAQLLDRLHAGRVAVIVFDAPKQREVAGVEQPVTQFLGRTVRCFFGPGWLAAHDNLPVVFVASYRANARIALDGPEVLYPEPALSTYEQTAAITWRLYALAERFIRAHPSAWLGWSYLDTFDMKRTQVPAHA